MPGTHARAPGLGGWLRLGAQALHCTRSGRAETHRRVPSCGVQGMLRGPWGTESGRSGGLGESQGKTSRSMSLPRLCGLSLVSCASSTLVQPKPLSSGCLLTLGPSFPPSLSSSALVRPSAQGVEPSGDSSGWKGEGQGGPAHLGGAVQIRLRLSLSWRGSCLVCPYPLRVTLSLLGGFQPQLLRPHPRKSHRRSPLCAGNRS